MNVTLICSFSDLPEEACDHCAPTSSLEAKAKHVEKLALKLMNAHGLLQEGWHFGFDSPKRRLGQCDYRTKTITLSAPWVEVLPLEKIEDTILHEIAHALVGGRAAHGPVWRAKARALGATPSACGDVGGVRLASPAAWIGTCPTCDRKVEQHRAPLRVKACADCCRGRWAPAHVLQWKKHGQTAPMPARYRTEYQHLKVKYGVLP